MLLGVIDTETTGILRGDYTSPDAPHLASATLIVYDTDKSRVQASFNTMIQPDDWEMPPEAGAVNGLDTETLQAFGIPIDKALPAFGSLLESVDLIVAHNAPFDVKIMASAFYRNDFLDEIDALFGKETYCTMRETKQAVQAKNIRGHLKMPRLTEAYEFFFDRPLDNAHSANADAVACLEIYLAYQAHLAEQVEEADDEGVKL